MVLALAFLLLTGCGVNKDSPAAGVSPDNAPKIAGSVQGSEATADNRKNPEQKNDTVQTGPGQEEASQQGTSSPGNSEKQTKGLNAKVSETSTGSETEPALTAAAPPIVSGRPEKTGEQEVTIAIYCSTAVAKGLAKEDSWKDAVPADGTILSPTKVKFKDGETVFDALKQVVQAKKIQMQYEGSKGNPYIKGINNLYEFDGGPLSGWMFSVNKGVTNYGCNQVKLQSGDLIEWNYTCDMGRDLQ